MERKVVSSRAAKLSILFAAAAPAAAHAETRSATMSVSATVTANCTVSTNAVAFGSIDPLGGNHDAAGSVTVNCTNGAAWSAAANAGSGTGATLANRRMTSGANALTYRLYTDAGRTSIWGDGSTGTAAVTGTGNGAAQVFTVYGRVPSGQTSVRAGSYSDTVSVTITY
jgi:spore coat protein U-like protein